MADVDLSRLECQKKCQACQPEEVRTWVAGALVEHAQLGLGKITDVTSAGFTAWFIWYAPALVFPLDTAEVKHVHADRVRIFVDRGNICEETLFEDPPINL